MPTTPPLKKDEAASAIGNSRPGAGSPRRSVRKAAVVRAQPGTGRLPCAEAEFQAKKDYLLTQI